MYCIMESVDTAFLRSAAAATRRPFCAATIWGQLVFEGGYYSRVATVRGRRLFLWKAPVDINDSLIRYIWVRRWRLVDVVRSVHSLSVLLSAVEMTHTTQIALALAWWPSSESIRTRVCVPHILAAATIRGRCLFRSELPIVWLLFEGSVYLKKYRML